MHCSDFRTDDCQVDVHGKHTPFDRPRLRATGFGPKQESAVLQVSEDQRELERIVTLTKELKAHREVLEEHWRAVKPPPTPRCRPGAK